MGTADRAKVRSFLSSSAEALDSGAHQFFSRHLGPKETWRAYPYFRDACAYLDIETDGRSVTTIGLYDGRTFTCLLKGQNLENFRDEISRYSMIVTFSGTAFDLPMLKRCFRGLQMDQLHLDLCPLLRRLGHRGGLKAIERRLGIERPEHVAGLSGFDAVVLWRRYIGLGDEEALRTLVDYNREDCVNLVKLADLAVARMQETFEEAVEAARA